MSTVQPQGEDLRKAVKWLSEQRESEPEKDINIIVQEACSRFDLSPKDADFLTRFAKEEIK